MVYNNILEAIGNTPMIKLNRMCEKDGADIYVKFEGLNVGGSIKTRTAYNMILEAEKQRALVTEMLEWLVADKDTQQLLDRYK